MWSESQWEASKKITDIRKDIATTRPTWPRGPSWWKLKSDTTHISKYNFSSSWHSLLNKTCYLKKVISVKYFWILLTSGIVYLNVWQIFKCLICKLALANMSNEWLVSTHDLIIKWYGVKILILFQSCTLRNISRNEWQICCEIGQER